MNLEAKEAIVPSSVQVHYQPTQRQVSLMFSPKRNGFVCSANWMKPKTNSAMIQRLYFSFWKTPFASSQGFNQNSCFFFNRLGLFFFLNKFQSDGRGDGVLLATNSTLHVRRRTISAVALLQQYVCCPVMLQQRRVNDANKINHKQSSPSESCAAERCLNEVVKKRCTGRKSPPVSIPPPRRCC